MLGNFLIGNRETSAVSEKNLSDRSAIDASRNPDIKGAEESDWPIVPAKAANEAQAEELREGRGRTKENTMESHTGSTLSEPTVLTGLQRVRRTAKEDKRVRFTALLHHLTVDLLRESFLSLKRKAAPGIDGQTWEQYGQNLEAKLTDLHGRVHRGAYRAKPSRRVYLEKPDGRKRPLGIAVLEDKIVQGAVVKILEAIYEEDFLGFSYGFRPERGAHDALDALSVALQFEKVNWVLDADIQSFFDTMSHEWTMKFLQHRIADPRMLGLIQKWLRAGVSEDGEWSSTTIGTPQGAVISPLLANVYLHYALDLWVHQWRRKTAGEMFIVRYADDVIFAFQYKGEATRFRAALADRLREFGLELHPQKTRLIEFGRFAEDQRRDRGQGPPETFDFLGLTHICGRDRQGKFQVQRRTMAKRMRAKLASIKLELRKRWHDRVGDTGQWLHSVVTGYYRYHAVPGNLKMLCRFRCRLARLWLETLRRRGGKRQLNWQRFLPLLDRWVPLPTIQHPYPNIRFAVNYPRWEPYAGKPHVRFCPGGAS
jgi:group II intron reverse transcriptase/maturase